MVGSSKNAAYKRSHKIIKKTIIVLNLHISSTDIHLLPNPWADTFLEPAT